jgi:hypothetical protein
MSPQTICNIIGWSLLIISWFPGIFTKNKDKRMFISIAASAIAVGVFIATAIYEYNG